MRILNSLLVPKYTKGETFWAFWHLSLLQNTIKTRMWDPLKAKKSKKVVQCRKKLKEGPFSLVRFRKCSKKSLAKARTRTRDHWVHRKPSKVCAKKRYIHDEVCGLAKKRKKTSHCNSRAIFTKKVPTKKNVILAKSRNS